MMPDGNSAALRAHESAESRAEATHDAYHDKVIESIVDDVIYGNGVKVGYPRRAYTARDVIEDKGVDMWLDAEDLANLATASIETFLDIQLKLEKRLKDSVIEWCETQTGAQVVADRVLEMEEDAREAAAEARRAVREEA
jgi:hypothetical protein